MSDNDHNGPDDDDDDFILGPLEELSLDAPAERPAGPGLRGSTGPDQTSAGPPGDAPALASVDSLESNEAADRSAQEADVLDDGEVLPDVQPGADFIGGPLEELSLEVTEEVAEPEAGDLAGEPEPPLLETVEPADPVTEARDDSADEDLAAGDDFIGGPLEELSLQVEAERPGPGLRPGAAGAEPTISERAADSAVLEPSADDFDDIPTLIPDDEALIAELSADSLDDLSLEDDELDDTVAIDEPVIEAATDAGPVPDELTGDTLDDLSLDDELDLRPADGEARDPLAASRPAADADTLRSVEPAVELEPVPEESDAAVADNPPELQELDNLDDTLDSLSLERDELIADGTGLGGGPRGDVAADREDEQDPDLDDLSLDDSVVLEASEALPEPTAAVDELEPITEFDTDLDDLSLEASDTSDDSPEATPASGADLTELEAESFGEIGIDPVGELALEPEAVSSATDTDEQTLSPGTSADTVEDDDLDELALDSTPSDNQQDLAATVEIAADEDAPESDSVDESDAGDRTAFDNVTPLPSDARPKAPSGPGIDFDEEELELDMNDDRIESSAAAIPELSAEGEPVQEEEVIDLPEETPTPEPATTEAPPPPPRRSLLTWVLLLIALLAAGSSGWLYWERYQQQDPGTVAARELQVQVANAQQLLAASSAAQLALENQVNQLRQELASSADAQAAMGAMLRSELAEIRDSAPPATRDWRVAEAEYLLRIANIRLRMERDQAGALRMLTAADDLLRELADFSLFEARQALAEDITALNAMPQVDVNGLYVRLQSLAQRADQLPVRGTHVGLPSAASADALPAPPGSLLEQITERLLSAVTVRTDLNTPAAPMMTSQEAWYIEQGLRVMLEQAQIALLRNREALYRQNLSGAVEWLDRWFVADDAGVQSARAALSELAGLSLTSDLPDISAGLNTLRALRGAPPVGGEEEASEPMAVDAEPLPAPAAPVAPGPQAAELPEPAEELSAPEAEPRPATEPEAQPAAPETSPEPAAEGGVEA